MTATRCPRNAADVSGLDIVLGDRYGASAAPPSLTFWNRASSARWLSRPTCNKPFAGGFYHRAFRRRAGGRSPCGSNRRDRPGALPRRAQDCPHRAVARAQGRSFRRREGAGAGTWGRSGSGSAGGRMRAGLGAPENPAEVDAAPQGDPSAAHKSQKQGTGEKRRPPCRHGGLESREETPKEGICGRSCRTATISALAAPVASLFFVPWAVAH